MRAISAIMLFAPFAVYAQMPFERFYDLPNQVGLIQAVEASNGDILAVGYDNDLNGERLRAMRTDAVGDTIWTRLYSLYDDYFIPRSMALADDDGMIITGASYHAQGWSLSVVRIDASGDTMFVRDYPNAADRVGQSIAQTPDGNYVVCGTIVNPDTSLWDIVFMKIDDAGNVLWEHSSPTALQEYADDVRVCADGSYLITGTEDLQAPASFALKLTHADTAGTLLWSRIYGAAASTVGRVALPLPNGGAWVMGTIKVGSLHRGFALRVDAVGDSLHSFTFQEGQDETQVHDVIPCAGGGFGILWSSYLPFMQKAHISYYDADGVFISTTEWGGPGISALLEGAAVMADGAPLLAGWHSGGGQQMFLVRAPVPSCFPVGIADPEQPALFDAFPSPFSNSLIIRLHPGVGPRVVHVHDALGRVVRTLPVGTDGLAFWDGANAKGAAMPAGLYIVRTHNGVRTVVKE